jgi:hypothetical protein
MKYKKKYGLYIVQIVTLRVPTCNTTIPQKNSI